MKRLLIVVLMMTCSLSWAKWNVVGGADNYDAYVDKSAIRRNGVIAKMWVLQDYVDVQNDSFGNFKSSKTLMAFNCQEETMALIAIVRYTNSMGEGNVVFSSERKESQWEWLSVVPSTVIEILLKVACGKK